MLAVDESLFYPARLSDDGDTLGLTLGGGLGSLPGEDVREPVYGAPARLELGMVAQEAPHHRPVEPLVAVGRILDRLDPRVADQPHQLGLAPPEQRPDQDDAPFRPHRPDAGQSADTRSALQPHQHCLGLVVGMMRRRDVGQPARLRPRP